MKGIKSLKRLMLRIVLLLITVVLLSYISRTPLASTVVGSKHDFSTSGGGTFYSTNEDEVCVFCHCHPIYSGGTWMNNVHKEHNNKTYKPDGTTSNNLYCIACHSVIPHGTKRSRLIVYDGRDTKYGAADPEPYRYVSGGVNFAALSGFKKAAGPNSYTKDNCYSKTSGCTTHSDKGGYDN